MGPGEVFGVSSPGGSLSEEVEVNHRRSAPAAFTPVTTKQNNMAAAGATSRQRVLMNRGLTLLKEINISENSQFGVLKTILKSLTILFFKIEDTFL